MAEAPDAARIAHLHAMTRGEILLLWVSVAAVLAVAKWLPAVAVWP
jgi:hypothetical protein